MKKKYDVVGMTCSACSTHVDKAVRGLDGVDDVNVNLLQNSMTVEFDENKLSESQIFEAVDKAGYKAQNIGEKQVSNVLDSFILYQYGTYDELAFTKYSLRS